MITLTPARCPNCQSTLTLDSEERAAICPFCGKPFVVQDAIGAYQGTDYASGNMTPSTTTSPLQFLELAKKQKVDDALLRVKQLQSEGNYSAAREKCKKLINDVDPRNVEAWHTLLEMSFLQYQRDQIYKWSQLLGGELEFSTAFLSTFLLGESASSVVDKILLGQNPGAKDALLAIEGNEAFQEFFDKYVQKVNEDYTVYRQKLTFVSGHTDWLSPREPWRGCIGNLDEHVVKSYSSRSRVKLERIYFLKKYVELETTYWGSGAASDAYTYTLKYLWDDPYTLAFSSGRCVRSKIRNRVKPEEVASTIKLLPYRYNHFFFFYLEPKSVYARYYGEIIQGKIMIFYLN